MKLYEWLLYNVPDLKMLYMCDDLTSFRDSILNRKKLSINIRMDLIRVNSDINAVLTVIPNDQLEYRIRGLRCSGLFLEREIDFLRNRDIYLPFLVTPINITERLRIKELCEKLNIPFENMWYPKPFVYLLREEKFLCEENGFNL